MCILQSCADPTQPGVWWRDDARWCLYSPANQQRIRAAITSRLTQIDLGLITSVVHPSGARYTVNLTTMNQVAVSSGQQRPVMVIDAVAAAAPQITGPSVRTLLPRNPLGRVRARVHYRDGAGNMHQYDPDIAQALLQAASSGAQRNLLVEDDRSGRQLFFDLVSMKQYVVTHPDRGEPVVSSQAPVDVIIEVTWDPQAMAALAVKADSVMRRKIIAMVIERYRSDDHLDAILPARAHPKAIVTKSSKYQSRPGHPVYEKFVDTMEHTFARCDKGVLGDLITNMEKTESSEGWPVEMVFQPARDAPEGRNLNAESKSAFWRSIVEPAAAAQAVIYGCAVQLKLIVYLVILPAAGSAFATMNRSAVKRGRCSDYVVVNKPGHRLSLAEVTVQ